MTYPTLYKYSKRQSPRSNSLPSIFKKATNITNYSKGSSILPTPSTPSGKNTATILSPCPSIPCTSTIRQDLSPIRLQIGLAHQPPQNKISKRRQYACHHLLHHLSQVDRKRHQNIPIGTAVQTYCSIGSNYHRQILYQLRRKCQNRLRKIIPKYYRRIHEENMAEKQIKGLILRLSLKRFFWEIRN